MYYDLFDWILIAFGVVYFVKKLLFNNILSLFVPIHLHDELMAKIYTYFLEFFCKTCLSFNECISDQISSADNSVSVTLVFIVKNYEKLFF